MLKLCQSTLKCPIETPRQNPVTDQSTPRPRHCYINGQSRPVTVAKIKVASIFRRTFKKYNRVIFFTHKLKDTQTHYFLEKKHQFQVVFLLLTRKWQKSKAGSRNLPLTVAKMVTVASIFRTYFRT